MTLTTVSRLPELPAKLWRSTPPISRVEDYQPLSLYANGVDSCRKRQSSRSRPTGVEQRERAVRRNRAASPVTSFHFHSPQPPPPSYSRKRTSVLGQDCRGFVSARTSLFTFGNRVGFQRHVLVTQPLSSLDRAAFAMFSFMRCRA